LVKLLSEPEIQATLFRKPTHIDEEKEARGLEKMHDEAPPKEITYILTLNKLLSETYIGYVKIKLIDWTVKSCYLSVALLPNAEYRGKGYAKLAYDTFFDYLFSLGIMKIYGRTHENNIATIKLNEATGFRLVGRQTAFILYPNSTKQDDLLFERLNPKLVEFEHISDRVTRILSEILTPLQHARISGHVTSKLLTQTIDNLKTTAPHPNACVNQFIKEVLSELTAELQAEFSGQLAISALYRSYSSAVAENASAAGYGFLSLPITKIQLDSFLKTCSRLEQLNSGSLNTDYNAVILDNAVWYGAYTETNWSYLRLLFLAKMPTKSASTIAAIKDTP
jgi:RimJ/RimL family protein N-acetyltransferase